MNRFSKTAPSLKFGFSKRDGVTAIAIKFQDSVDQMQASRSRRYRSFNTTPIDGEILYVLLFSSFL